MNIVVVTGGFDPLHSGHIDYFRAARQLGDYLIVGMNTNKWLERKKGKAFMSEKERRAVLESLKMVDEVCLLSDTSDTVDVWLSSMIEQNPDDNIIFANGGDRTEYTTPEVALISHPRLSFTFNVGGTKTQSSTDLLNNYKDTERVWGWFTELFKDDRVKVKELVIEPGKGISYQKHFKRSEIWFISHGQCTVKHSRGKRTDFQMHNLREDDIFDVRANEWHQIYNPYSKPCHVIEIQYGQETNEEDILRDET